MMITSEGLKGALERLEPWHWRGNRTGGNDERD